MPGAQAGTQGILVDNAAARGIDQHGAGFHLRQPFRIDHAPGRRGERHVQADDVGLGKQRLEFAPRRQLPRRIVVTEKRVAGDGRHAEGGGPARHLARNRSKADQADGLAGNFPADQPLARPGAGGNGIGGAIGAAQEHERHCQDMFGNRLVIGAGGWIDGDPACAAGIEIDIVEPDTEPPDALQTRCRVEEGGIDARPVAHDQRPRAGDKRRQLVLPVSKAWVVMAGMAARQPGDRFVVHELGDDDGVHLLRPVLLPCAHAGAIRRYGTAWS